MATLPAVAGDLKLYVKNWCPWCITAKSWLNRHGYRYQEVDVDKNRAAYDEMIQLSNQTYTPTLVVNGKVLPDFGPEELEAFLKKNSITP